jgi:nicotinate-nucleotide pyrophosphorylase (carboxylating)
MNEIDDILIKQIEVALIEDIGPGDITTLATIGPGTAKAAIVAKSEGVLAGLPIVESVFSKLDADIEIFNIKKDGQPFVSGETIAEYKGQTSAILTGERTALNYLGHLSGIASLVSEFVHRIKGTGAVILDTRKTTPGLRYLEKYAVTCGGGQNHRYGLYDMVLIKDNHIAACGTIREAVEKTRMYLNDKSFVERFGEGWSNIIIEVEVESEEQLREAVDCGVKRLLLDNRSPEQLATMVKLARSLSDDLKLEASGNVRLDNVRKIAETGVDYISIGALTHSAPSSDFSLNIVK